MWWPGSPVRPGWPHADAAGRRPQCCSAGRAAVPPDRRHADLRRGHPARRWPAGHVQIDSGERRLLADEVTYDQARDRVLARGHVVRQRAGRRHLFRRRGRAHGGPARRVRRQRPHPARRRFPGGRDPGRAHRGPLHRARQGGLLALPALRGQRHAAVADPGPQGGPRPGRAHRHLPRRRAGDVRRPGGLHALVHPPRPGREAGHGIPHARLRLQHRARPLRRGPLLLEPGAQPRLHLHADPAPRTPGLCSPASIASCTSIGSTELDASFTYTDAYAREPGESEGKELRGHIRGEGRYDFGDDGQTGFDLFLTSDNSYLKRYDFSSSSTLENRAFVERYPDRNFMGLNGYYFQGLREDDNQDRIPIVLPLAESRLVSEPMRWGSHWTLDSSLLALTRARRARHAAPLQHRPPGRCRRSGASASVYRLEASLRGDAYYTEGNPETFSSTGGSNATGRLLPRVTGDVSWPLIGDGWGWTYELEPLTQLSLAPEGGNHERHPERGQPRLRVRRDQPPGADPLPRARPQRGRRQARLRHPLQRLRAAGAAGERHPGPELAHVRLLALPGGVRARRPALRLCRPARRAAQRVARSRLPLPPRQRRAGAAPQRSRGQRRPLLAAGQRRLSQPVAGSRRRGGGRVRFARGDRLRSPRPGHRPADAGRRRPART